MNKAIIFFLFVFVCTGSLSAKSILPEDGSRIAYGKTDTTKTDFFHTVVPDGVIFDSIAVHKAAHELLVFSDSKLLKKYKVQLGICPVGCKQFNGDCKTPEGHYYINSKNPQSKFHKSLGVSYPNAEDILRAHKAGKMPGGDIMIHGLPNGDENVGPDRYQNDWTWGCIAVRNEVIDELFQHINMNIPVVITP